MNRRDFLKILGIGAAEAIYMGGVGKVSLLAKESNDVRPNCLVKVA